MLGAIIKMRTNLDSGIVATHATGASNRHPLTMEETREESGDASTMPPNNNAGPSATAPADVNNVLKTQLTTNHHEEITSSTTESKMNNNDTPLTPIIITTENRNKMPRKGGTTFLTLAVHLLLMITFAALGTVYCLRQVHDDYFLPILARARRTDTDLLDEFTYYDRQCSVADLTATAQTAHDLVIHNNGTAVDQMMRHGTVIVPQVLTPGLVKELRDFVVWKNDVVEGTSAEFPVSQGRNRISYGIDATEHPTITKVLKEIHDNKALESLLVGLVGKNPALTEITAITAKFGCPDQYWHSDVKADGNPLQFARTYSHSYSLFIPLQDTTGEMGATDLCPGTHYCADQLHKICELNKIGLHQLDPEGIWHAGDSALFNQQVWHRGPKHTDPDAPDRIVFIVSFIGRPTDNRQLSRGTYFHMKWNMWYV
jgi:hypothetical protein